MATIPLMSDMLISDKAADEIVADPWSGASAKRLQPIASFGWSQTGPWNQQQPYLTDLFSRARSQINQGSSPFIAAGQGMRLDLARVLQSLYPTLGNQALNTAGQGMDALGFLTNPNILSPTSNPYLAAQGQAITNDVNRNLLENILPQIRSGAVDTGSYGGTRQGITEGQAITGTSQQLSDSLANLYGGAYQQGLGTMLGAAGQANQSAQGYGQLSQLLGQLLGQPSQMVSSVGTEQTMLPWLLLEQYKNAVGGTYGEEGRTIKTDPGYKVGESMIGSFKNLMGSIGGMMGGA